jgi:subtilase family serine protease
LRYFRCALAALALTLVVGCGSASHSSLVPSLTGKADGGQALPGDGGHALPGDGGHALPGAQLACALPTKDGQASCTVAINVNVAPVGDPTTPASLIPGLHPSDLQNAYALPSQNSAGTVAVVDAYDDPAAESDLGVYRSAFGMTACSTQNGCFQKVNEVGAAGSYPAVDNGWSEEIALDLDMVSAACPNCKILLVEANSASIDDLGKAVDTAVAMGANAVSNSYYAPEWSGETSEDVHYTHPGVAMTASSGDQGYPSYPAASAHVTSVGGTTLNGSAGAWNETPWPYGGSGCSAYVAKPAWQKVASCSTRSAVDVAAVADPQTGVAMFDTQGGGWLVAGGTSVGAPLVASAYALAHSTAGPAFSYQHRAAFHDIAPAGYDLATGLGSPNGVSGL